MRVRRVLDMGEELRVWLSFGVWGFGGFGALLGRLLAQTAARFESKCTVQFTAKKIKKELSSPL